MKRLTLLLPLLFLSFIALGQLRSGPMIAYTEMREALIWVQCTAPGEVYLRWEDGEGNSGSCSPATLQSHFAFTAHLPMTNLEPGTTYQYEVRYQENGQNEAKELARGSLTTRSDWPYKTDPPTFSLLTGSCAYVNEPPYDRPGRPYGGDYDIFEQMAGEDAQAMLWLGDNTYLRPADWNSRSGIFSRYSHTRSLPQLQTLLKKMEHVAIWDDHDYGPNNSLGSFPYKHLTEEAFETFWPDPSRDPGVPGTAGYRQIEDVEVFLTDGRWFRQMDDSSGAQLGKAQIDQLIERLRNSYAPFKLVLAGSQVLSTSKTGENHVNYAEEHRYLLEQLDKYRIPGVVFLSGDRHFSELSEWKTPSGQLIIDFTCSPLTSGSYESDEVNGSRVEGTLVSRRNYGKLSFSGPFRNRTMTLRCISAQGEVLWEKIYSQQDLK